MTKRLIHFINDIEHFDPKFIYHPDHLQKILDALSRMSRFREKGDPADTSHLFEIEHSESIFESAKIIIPHNIEFYIKLHDSLKRNTASGAVRTRQRRKILESPASNPRYLFVKRSSFYCTIGSQRSWSL